MLVTGAAGFIGAALCKALLERGVPVVGLDNLNPYYDPALKLARLARLTHPGFEFIHADIADRDAMRRLFDERRFTRVVHFAAQAGVRHSLKDPHAYADANLVGFLNVLEGCRHAGTEHLIYASTSSVYGANPTPFSEHQRTDGPLSLYAATKKANEVMAHAYSHLFGLPCTGLRFFTVYGPWGRPDMAAFLFADAILAGRPIEVFNHGNVERDFTYIDDIVESVLRVIDRPAGWQVFNVGNSDPVPVGRFIDALESALGRKAIREYLPMQAGDVVATHADTSALADRIGYAPSTPLEVGVGRFAEWFKGLT
jgi:UDP-glucuronate 4-epimerase